MLTRHLLHLSNQELVCVPWRFGRPLAERRFKPDAEGLAAFSDYLAGWQHVPVRIAVDLIEEDFRIETVPHLRGSDRRTVIERRLNQLYRATPFRAAALQGRETSGRKDDILLCTAITQSEGLSVWLDVLARWRIPVLGVYPTAVIAEQLLRKLGIPVEQLLLVTLLGQGAVRISFFQHGRLKFSRISEPDLGDDRNAALGVREEARKTMQYVSAQTWFLRGLQTHSLLIADEASAPGLRQAWADADPPLQLISPGGIARRLRFRHLPAHAGATALLLSLLMAQPPREQLAPAERIRDGRLWYLRTAVFGLSALLGLAAIVMAGSDILHGLDVRAQSEALRSQLALNQQVLTTLQQRLPVTVVTPSRMSATVRFDQLEVAQRPRLEAFARSLAQALDANPSLQLRRFSWTLSTDHPSLNQTTQRNLGLPSGQEGPLITTLAGRRFAQDVRLEGRLEPFDGEPATAQASLNAFATTLRAQGWLVQLARQPFDLNPAHVLNGSAVRTGRRSPEFAMHAIRLGAP